MGGLLDGLLLTAGAVVGAVVAILKKFSFFVCQVYDGQRACTENL